MIGCAKTEMVSEDNTVTNENIVSTTGTIAIETEVIETEVIETETQDAIQPSSDQPPDPPPEYKIIMVGDVLLHTPVEESCLQPDVTTMILCFPIQKRRLLQQILPW